jgi:hypothetical protein
MARLSHLRPRTFIDTRTKQVQPKTKVRSRGNGEKRGGPSCKRQRSAAYVYAIIVDSVVRYIGKGRNGQMYTHLIEAKRTSARCPRDTTHLYPRIHRKLVEAVRTGSQIMETIITSDLTDRAAYRLESKMIGEFHKMRAGQLWNTIDERFLDPQYLPDEWDDPEHPLYRLPRRHSANFKFPAVGQNRKPTDCGAHCLNRETAMVLRHAAAFEAQFWRRAACWQ